LTPYSPTTASSSVICQRTVQSDCEVANPYVPTMSPGRHRICAWVDQSEDWNTNCLSMSKQ
jgi:hypothetical protein